MSGETTDAGSDRQQGLMVGAVLAALGSLALGIAATVLLGKYTFVRSAGAVPQYAPVDMTVVLVPGWIGLATLVVLGEQITNKGLRIALRLVAIVSSVLLMHATPYPVSWWVSCAGVGLLLVGLTRFNRNSRAQTVARTALLVMLCGAAGALLWPEFCHSYSLYTRTNNCLNAQKQLATATLLYAGEHAGYLPTAAEFWTHAGIAPLPKRCEYHIDDSRREGNTYIANGPICGKALAIIPAPAQTFLTADGKDGNTIQSCIGTTFEDFSAYRHGNHRVVASFVDGHFDIAVPVADDPHWLPGRGTP